MVVVIHDTKVNQDYIDVVVEVISMVVVTHDTKVKHHRTYHTCFHLCLLEDWIHSKSCIFFAFSYGAIQLRFSIVRRDPL